MVYDARGNVVEEAYFGVDGAAISDCRGIHMRHMEVDHLERILHVRYFGVAGDKVTSKNRFVQNDHIEDLLGPLTRCCPAC